MAQASRIFTDPVWEMVKFDKKDPLEALALELIDTPAFQRLRNIKQLGQVSHVYPNANHTRFSHSLGTFFVAREMCDEIKKQGFEDKDKRDTTLIAALLHDVGHGPYSHVFEMIAQKGLNQIKAHEEWSSEIILNYRPITDKLNAYRPGFSQEVAQYISMPKSQRDLYPSIISSSFDADRLDYMCRDRQMCGIDGSVVNKRRIINSLEVFEDKKGRQHLGIKINALHAVEEFLSSRLDLYKQIYMHKREYVYVMEMSKFMQALMKKPELLDDKYSSLENILKGDTSLSNYLKTSDKDVDRLVERMSESKDKPLAKLAKRVLSRRAYRCIDMSISNNAEEKMAAAKKALSSVPGVVFEDKLLRAYNKEKDVPIYIIDHRDSQQVFELSEISESNVGSLSKRIFRAYVPKKEEKSLDLILIKGRENG